ncbi:hypothetical protein [Alicyclobacillus fodiniaquatilis]|uniref:Lipoprotein n=1 Tax=Alicyclobacillus fodiniaquatilis TaxID=1661150 RepID=A0ABW4JHJ4_9BACL
MKRQAATAALILSAVLLVTACGTKTQPTLAPTNSTETGAKQTNKTTEANQTNTTNETNDNTSPKTNTQTEENVKLVQFTDADSGIQVQVPQGWTKSLVSGGDYSGWKFTNPNDANQSETVVTSTCVGCYMDANNKADPTLVIPKTATDPQTKASTATSVTYAFTASGNTNPGLGKVVVSTDKSGYAYVETLFPQNQASVSSDVIDSLQLNR